MAANINNERVTRIVDFKIRLEWLLGIAILVGSALVSTYYKTDQLVVAVADLQIAVKSGNSSVTAIAGKQALIDFRMDNAENAIKKADSAILILQQRGSK